MSDSLKENFKDIILDSITDGVFCVDKEWKITFFNKAAERITSVSREDAIGRNCWEIFHASICEKDCALKRTIQTNQPVINKAIYIIDATGRRVPVSISTAVLRDDHGEVIGGIETFRDLSAEEELRKELAAKYSFADIIGRSPEMQRLFAILPRVADSDSTVLITGPSGTGKELVARAIHNLSARRDKPFVAVNCAALPDTLLESELFGYKAGAFTDARADKPGRFALAEGGTIFLDEIGDISPAMQSKLLRVLQDKVYEPLGATEPVKADVRILAATNKDIEKLVEKGIFREDLYYRINIVKLELPPLRQRKEDIPLLIEHFVDKFNRLANKNIAGVSQEAMAILMDYDYPGNVRELENIIEHAFVLCSGGLIKPEHLPSRLRGSREAAASISGGPMTLKALEAIHIADALRRHKGNRTAAAKELGINPSTLYRKLKSLQIDVPKRDGRSSKSMK